MDLKAHILSAAERTFDSHGFAGTGMDRLTEASGVSSRTLYKHIGSKTALIAAVLEERRQRFRSIVELDSVDALFAALERWTAIEGARGCLFFRARAEMGEDTPAIADAVAIYRRDLRDVIDRVVANDVGDIGRTMLTEQILVLFEGATSAASYRGLDAISAARSAAAVLVEQTRRRAAGSQARDRSSQA